MQSDVRTKLYYGNYDPRTLHWIIMGLDKVFIEKKKKSPEAYNSLFPTGCVGHTSETSLKLFTEM